MRPKLLDLFCGAGGAAMGYHWAGFDIVGVDINPQPRYPFEFVQADAMTFPLDGFDVIHASPPCQAYSRLKSMTTKEHPNLLSDTRARLEQSEATWIIENVYGAALSRGSIMLCGAMFGLQSYRHRYFESDAFIFVPEHPKHKIPCIRGSRQRKKVFESGGIISICGNVGSYPGPKGMGIDWMTGAELSQAIPPAFTEWIGKQLKTRLDSKAQTG